MTVWVCGGSVMHVSVGVWWFGDACFTVWVCGGSVKHVSQCGSVVVW